MESEKTPSLYPSLNPDTLVETAGEKPTVIQNPTEDRPGKKPYNESAEIQSNFVIPFVYLLIIICLILLAIFC